MGLFARMGGAPPDGLQILSCCGVCPGLPLILLLAGLAVFRHSLLSAFLALLLTALPLVLLLVAVANYEPSDDWEDVTDQAGARQLAVFYGGMTALAGLSLLCALLKWPPQKRDESTKAAP